MSRSESKGDPKAPDKILIVTKESVALSQLQTAITLWFNYGDPISILALAYAANDCYSALGGHIGKPSTYREWIKTKSKPFQRRASEVQNFVKHGLKNLKGKMRYMPRLGEILISDSINCHENVSGDTTALMELFTIRFALENPGVVPEENRPMYVDGPEIQELRNWDRPTFLSKGADALSVTFPEPS
jgi:hypothetical protein